MTKQKTDDLIKKLCGDLEPQDPRCPYRRISVWLVLSVAYIVGVIWYFGPKVDIAEHFTNAAFVFEMTMMVAILISSALASSWLSFPDCMQRDWMKIVATTLFASFLVWVFANGVEEGMDFATFYMPSCSKSISVEIIPFLALVYLSAKGHTTQPYWSMAMNVMAVSSLGWIGLRLTCSMYESMTYGFIHYLLPFAILGAGVGFFARKLFKW